MRELRVVLVKVPPFLADLIRQVVAPRFIAEPLDVALSIISEISDTPDLVDLVGRLAPHVLILGTAAAVTLNHEARRSTDLRVLRLSTDLTRIYGPGAADSAAFTPDALADRLLDIAKRI